jgi:hypothetical protein
VAVTRARAALRIGSESATAAGVSTALGIEPSHAFERGEPFGRHGGVREHALWMLDSSLADSEPLERHLYLLLELIAPAADAVDVLASDGYWLDWFCFVSQDGQGAVELSPNLLQSLSRHPISLVLDLYGGEE